MRVTSNKDDHLFSQFDNINENDLPFFERLYKLPPQNLDTQHQKM